MDQQTLRQWEARCIQEEPPFCQAACPLRLDGRALCGLLAKGDATGARKLLERTLPLPGVMGRLCEGPCRSACKRQEAGEALDLPLLERFALAQGRPGPRPMRLPKRPGGAVILGHGLAALSCAWDLLKKGWSVTLRTGGRPLGGALVALPAQALPPEVLPAELATLKALGLSLDETPGQGRDLLAGALASGAPLLLEWGFSPETDADYPARADVDPVTLARPLPEGEPPQIFYGGWPDAAGTFRFIDAAADGRRAASSLDRRLSGVSLTAARDKEGAQPTRLFTSLAGVEPATRVAPAAGDYAPDEAAGEAARCLGCQCLECVKVCPYLEKHKTHPKAYARQIYNNAAIVKGQHMANKLVNSCSLCGLCARVCPEGFDMGELCLAARRDMVERAAMPPSAHEFALEDLAWANDPSDPGGFALTRPDPAGGSCASVFFPGCQLCASSPQHVKSVYAHLRAHMAGGVGLLLRCCGVPADWAGSRELFARAAQDFVGEWERLGRPLVIAACAGCLAALRRPEYRQAAPDLRAVSLWEALNGLPPAPGGFIPAAPLALHDPCTARDDAVFRTAARALAVRAGACLEELPLSGELAECCGFGGLMGQVDPELARSVAARRAGESARDYLSCCAMCRDRLFKAGKPGLHLLDLLFPSTDAEPALRPVPGWSARRENRAALRAELLRELWGEAPAASAGEVGADDGAADAGPELVLAPGVEEQLEERRILLPDLRLAIGQALASGRLLADADPAGHGRLLASFRPRRVTFWAEFVPEHGRYRLLRAWSHRMIVPGSGGVAETPVTGNEAVNRVDQTYLPDGGVWRCRGCAEPLAPAPVVMSYLGSVFTILLLTCPVCCQTLVPESLALGRMAEVEQLLEDK